MALSMHTRAREACAIMREPSGEPAATSARGPWDAPGCTPEHSGMPARRFRARRAAQRSRASRPQLGELAAAPLAESLGRMARAAAPPPPKTPPKHAISHHGCP
eukprot:3147840-Prymnesium_polylepis.1